MGAADGDSVVGLMVTKFKSAQGQGYIQKGGISPVGGDGELIQGKIRVVGKNDFFESNQLDQGQIAQIDPHGMLAENRPVLGDGRSEIMPQISGSGIAVDQPDQFWGGESAVLIDFRQSGVQPLLQPIGVL